MSEGNPYPKGSLSHDRWELAKAVILDCTEERWAESYTKIRRILESYDALRSEVERLRAALEEAERERDDNKAMAQSMYEDSVVGYERAKAAEAAPSRPSPEVLRRWAEWFDDPNESPDLAIDFSRFVAKVTPGMLLRLVADAMERKPVPYADVEPAVGEPQVKP